MNSALQHQRPEVSPSNIQTVPWNYQALNVRGLAVRQKQPLDTNTALERMRNDTQENDSPKVKVMKAGTIVKNTQLPITLVTSHPTSASIQQPSTVTTSNDKLRIMEELDRVGRELGLGKYRRDIRPSPSPSPMSSDAEMNITSDMLNTHVSEPSIPLLNKSKTIATKSAKSREGR